MTDTILTLPTFCQPWGPSGPTIYLPGHASYVDGTDISDALFWLFTRTAFDGTTVTPGIGATPYAALSGTSETSRTVFRFPGGLTSWIEEGFQLGLGSVDNKQRLYTTIDGVDYRWPKYPAHAWRHIRIESDDPDNRHILWQEDDTPYGSGIIPDPKGGPAIYVATTANSTTAVLASALSVSQAASLNADGATIQSAGAGAGDPTYAAVGDTTAGSNVVYLSTALGVAARGFVQSVQSDTGSVFPGGQYGSNIVSINSAVVWTIGTTVVPEGTPGAKSWVPGKIITLADNATTSNTNLHLTFFNPDGHPFDGGTRGEDVTAVGVDRKTLTLANPAWWTRTHESCTLYLSPTRPERAEGVPLFVVDGPGDWLGDERGAYSYDITVDDIIIRGSNADDLSGIASGNPDGIGREQWIAIQPRRVTGLVLDGPYSTDVVYDGAGLTIGEGVTIEHAWSDGLFLGGAPEDIVFSAKVNGCGRHWITYQGCVGLRAHRSAGKNVERLGIDVETTSVTARCIDAEITDCVVSPGTALVHASPANLISEPSRIVDSLGTTLGSKLVTAPGDLIQADDRGGMLTHPNLPDGTYVRRRMGPTIFEASQAATATGTADGILTGGVLFQDFTLRNIGLFTTNGNCPCDFGPSKGKVYFTYLVDTATNAHQMYDIQFDARHDGQTFTTDDIGTARVFWGQGGVPGTGLFPGNGAVPTAHTATTLTFSQTSANSTPATDWTITGVCTAGSVFVTSNVKLTNADVKSHVITAPSGVFRPDTFIARLGDTTSAQIELNVPAKVSGTFPMTISKRAHGYFAGDDSVRWTGFNFEEIRPLTDALWSGTGLVTAPLNQPCIMAPLRTDKVTISRNFLLGKRSQPSNAIVRYIAGAHAGSGAGAPFYGEPPGYDFTVEDNYGPSSATTGMVDNQVSPPPTVTVSLVMTVDDHLGFDPVFTVACTRSDSQVMANQHIVLTRDGSDIGPAITDASGIATFRSEDFTDPLDPGDGPRAFQARWGNSFGGSWDTQGALSNTITIRPGDVDPFTTTTTLTTNWPDGFAPEGYSLDLFADVTPTPYSQQGTVTFYDGATELGTSSPLGTPSEDALHSITLPTGLSVGAHAITAVFNGTAAYLTSTSNIVNLTVNAGPGIQTTTTTLTVGPPSPQTYPQEIALAAVVTPAGQNVGGGTVTFHDTGTAIGTVNVIPDFPNSANGTATLVLTPDIGTHSYTATYNGTAAHSGSTSTAVPFVSNAPDTTAPSVIGTDPYDGEFDVEPERTITVTFDPDVATDAPTVGDGYGGIYLTTDTETPTTIVGVIDGPFGDDGNEWTFTPNQPLAFDTPYLIVVRDFTDVGFGNVMVPYQSQFRTGADVNSTEYVPRGLLVARR